MNADIFGGVTSFVRAAEAHSFTRAARFLGLTPSAVSKSVSRLERELGVRLFNRSPREVSLTSEGEDFFARCQDLVHGMEDARALVGGVGSEPKGLVRICAPVTFGEYVLARALPDFLAQLPNLRVELILTDRLPDLVEERIDLAVRIGEVPDSRLIAKPIMSRPFVTTASKAYLRKHGTPKTPADLATHNCLGYLMLRTGGTRTWTFENDPEKHLIQPAGSVSSGRAAVLLGLAKAGVGIIHTPPYLVSDAIKAGKLVEVLTGYRSVGQSLSVVYPRSRYGSAKLKACLLFVAGLANCS